MQYVILIFESVYDLKKKLRNYKEILPLISWQKQKTHINVGQSIGAKTFL